MRFRQWIREYLTFTRKERIGLIAIVLLIFMIWIFPNVVKTGKSQSSLADTTWMTAVRALQQKAQTKTDSNTSETNLNELIYDRPVNTNAQELFYFDPNTLSPVGWKKLGVPPKTIKIIQNYLSKGGHFRKPDDLRKIYGIRAQQFEHLAPYVRIPEAEKEDFTDFAKSNVKKDRIAPSSFRIITVEINSADTGAFIALPGIGSKLAARIVNFRDKLGGFYSVSQVGETFGLPDSTFKKIRPMLKCENPSVRKINVNRVTMQEMRSHPYFKWVLANAIIEYRNQHGNFSSVEELKNIAAISDELFLKIKPYVSTE